MTKDVLISVSGLQMGEEKPEQIEVISTGNFYQKNGYSYVFYDEVIEGFDQRVRNMIKFKNGALHVQKKGIVNVNMAFEEEKKNNTCYTTPYGDIMIGIDTDSVEISEEEDHISLDVAYRLEANYEHLADCRIKMDIRSKESGMPLME